MRSFFGSFLSHDHRFDDLEKPSIQQGNSKPISSLCDDVRIGPGKCDCCWGHFLPEAWWSGPTPVVAGRLDTEFGIYAGVPARLIKKRGTITYLELRRDTRASYQSV